MSVKALEADDLAQIGPPREYGERLHHLCAPVRLFKRLGFMQNLALIR